MRTILRFFFRLLYHPFAFAYDLVAAVVSFGQWKHWTLEVVPFIRGTRTLEIGHGPGHLQRIILDRGFASVAIDESSEMGRLAKRNTDGKANLTRGLAQQLPFRNGSFDTIVATFPAEYITDPQTLSEVKRCLSDGGRFVVLPVAMPKNRFLSWMFKVTGQAPSATMTFIQDKLKEPFIKFEFNVDIHVLERSTCTLIVLIATKKVMQIYVQQTS